MSGPPPRSNCTRDHAPRVRCCTGHVPLTLDGDLFLDPGLTEPSLPAVGGTKKFEREAPEMTELGQHYNIQDKAEVTVYTGADGGLVSQ